MGFLDTFKRALGFSSAEDDDVEVDGIDATVTPLRQRNQLLQAHDDDAKPETDSAASTDCRGAAPAAADVAALPDSAAIFEKVVEVFNATLPDFLRNSVDPEKERRQLFDALDEGMKDYFNSLERNVERRLQARFEGDRRRLQEQIESLRDKARKEEEGNSNAKNLQLSAERQKRALSERVHDLEKQLADLEAENEQYILENKSMANKLRLAAISGEGGDADVAAAVEARLAEMQKLVDDSEARCRAAEADKAASEAVVRESESSLADARQKLAEMEGQCAELNEKLAQAESRSAADAEQIKSLQSKIDAAAADGPSAEELSVKVELLEEEVGRLNSSLEQAKVKDELSRTMVNDLNGRAAQARKDAEEKERIAAELKAKLDEVSGQLAASNSRLAKAQDDLQVVREVQEQMVRLEENQRVNEAELRRQKDELLEKEELLRVKDADILSKNTTMRIKDETIRRLEDQADSLRRSIESVQYEKTQTESALRTEIERLKSIKGLPSNPAPMTDAAYVAEEPAEDVAAAYSQDAAAGYSEDSIPDLTLDLNVTENVEAKPKPRRGRPPKVKTADDEPVADAPAASAEKKSKDDDDSDFSLLDSTDWLIAEPKPAAEPKRKAKKAKAESDDFGYKEPVRQDPPDSPAQMLLW